jgi:hypothetical protein
MLLATLLLMCPLPQSGDVAKAEIERPAMALENSSSTNSTLSNPATPSNPLPNAPDAKVKTDSEIAKNGESGSVSPTTNAEPVTPANPAGAAVVKPAARGDQATDQEKKTWYALIAVSSGAAVLDAWSTRRAIEGGYGTEANPLLRPFVHSNGLYAAIQVSPVVMDVVGRKMMTSRYHWMRKLWWAPQMAGTDVSASAAIHNLSVAH